MLNVTMQVCTRRDTLASRRCRCRRSTLCEQLAISIQTRRMASPSLHTPFHSIWRCCIHVYTVYSRYNAGMHSPWHYRRVYTVGDLLYTMKTSREARLASRHTHLLSIWTCCRHAYVAIEGYAADRQMLVACRASCLQSL